MSERATDTMTTYKRRDGHLIDDFGWVTELEWLDDLDAPVELIREVWTRTEHAVVVKLPGPLFGSCEIEDDVECENDAEKWWRSPDGVWMGVCSDHAPSEAHEPHQVVTFGPGTTLAQDRPPPGE